MVDFHTINKNFFNNSIMSQLKSLNDEAISAKVKDIESKFDSILVNI